MKNNTHLVFDDADRVDLKIGFDLNKWAGSLKERKPLLIIFWDCFYLSSRVAKISKKMTNGMVTMV